MSQTVDFGAPSDFGMHHFYVEIPAGPREAIRIYEDYGFDGDESRRETTECRVVLARELWTKIRDDSRRDFNARLKAKKENTGSWITGKVKLDRFLGRELSVLAWAAEPHLEARHKIGFRAIIYLFIITVLVYFSMKKLWSRIESKV